MFSKSSDADLLNAIKGLTAHLIANNNIGKLENVISQTYLCVFTGFIGYYETIEGHKRNTCGSSNTLLHKDF